MPSLRRSQIAEGWAIGAPPYSNVRSPARSGQTDRIRNLRSELDAWFETYVDPVLDGRELGVTGRGQRDNATQEDAFAYRFPWID